MLPNYERPRFDPELAKRLQKPAPQRLVKGAAKATVSTTDKKERAKCRERSGGQCEVWETFMPIFAFDKTTMKEVPPSLMVKRCKRRASENHHLIGGIGRRNKGRSILAAHRLDTCGRCHKDITGNVLVSLDGTKKEDAATVRFERRKL
jgi:hypothetical protein